MAGQELVYVIGVPFQLDALLLGALIALLWRGAHRRQLQTVSTVLLGIGTFLLALYAVHERRLHPSGFLSYFTYPSWRITWGLSLVDLYAAVLIVCALRPNSLTYRIFDLRPLRRLGQISYGAYVFHDIPHVAYAIFTNGILRRIHSGAEYHSDLAVLFVAFVATVALASLSYRFFETPFLNLKERWAPAHRYIHSAPNAEEPAVART